MARDDLPWGWQIARTASAWVPIAWLVFELQVSVVAWSQANVDNANRVHSPVREVVSDVLAFPLWYCPGLYNLINSCVGGRNALVVWMGLNALCWEGLLAPLVNRRLANALFCADVLAELLCPDGGLVGHFIR